VIKRHSIKRTYLRFLASISHAELFAVIIMTAISLIYCANPAFAQSIKHGASMIIPTNISDTNDLTQNLRAPDIVFGLFTGVMLTAALYLFFIWIVIRDKGQVFLMLLLLCLAVNMASTNDTIMQSLGIFNLTMRNLLQSYSMILAYFFALFFTYYFLDIENNAPFMCLPTFIFSGCLFLLLIYSSFDQTPIHFILPTLGVFSISIILITGLSTLRLGISGSLSHLTAFSFFLAGNLAVPLYDLGFIIKLDSAKNASYMGYSIAAMMFAIVIAGQFAARQEEKEKALETSNERFSLAAKGSNEGLFDWNRKTNSVYISDQFYKITGTNKQNKNKSLRSWLHYIYPIDRKLFFRALRKIKETRGSSSINFEVRAYKNDKEKYWIHIKMIAVKAPNSDKIIRLVGSIGDITGRKRSEAALKASEIRFRSITEAQPVPVMISRLSDNQIIYASPGAEILLGTHGGTIISNKLDRFLFKSVERDEILNDIKKGEEINLKEVSITKGDGEILPAALSARKINYRNEESMVIGLYDLTERKKAEKQIEEQQEALQQSEKMAALGGLLAGVAHELNNPLSVVMGQTTLLTENQPDDKIKKRGEKIFKAADRCSRIVKSFLALARRKPPEHKNVNINTIIQSSLELLGYQYKNENVKLNVDLEENLPPIIGDDDQLTQVFINLALNAAQAMHDWDKKREVTIQTKTDLENNQIITSVIDTGPGVPQDIRKKIFEPFFTTKGNGGTGVGLALCMNIVASHSGKLLLEDTKGGGTTFKVLLPIAKEEDVQKEDQKTTEHTKEIKLKILIVDDEIELAETLADLLEPEGHYIDLALNGEIALEKLRKSDFDIIISDLRMPVMDGIEMYANIKTEMPKYLNKIIYVTGDTLSPHVNAFLSENPVPVIDKPYRLDDVKNAILKLLKD